MITPLPAPLSGGARLRGTWDDVGAPSADLVWRHLRALRNDPPGHAQTKGNRRNAFCASLEQAEQMFAAAAKIDYATRPVLLFYGLSQAGRAIAAASVQAGSNAWKLKGHGIIVRNLDQTPPLSDLTIINEGQGSFTQLAPLLRSGSLPQGATLSELWAAVPDLPADWIDHGLNPHKVALRIEAMRIYGGRVVAWVHNLPWIFAAEYTEGALVEYLDSYPSLAGSTNAGDTYALTRPHERTRTAEVPRAWPMPDDRDLRAFENRLTQPYKGDDDRWTFPAVGGSTQPIHPLLAWWATLFALSVLARYEPGSWTKALDVDSSPNSVPLETALDRALDVCPQLILHAIRAVSTPSSGAPGGPADSEGANRDPS